MIVIKTNRKSVQNISMLFKYIEIKDHKRYYNSVDYKTK